MRLRPWSTREALEDQEAGYCNHGTDAPSKASVPIEQSDSRALSSSRARFQLVKVSLTTGQGYSRHDGIRHADLPWVKATCLICLAGQKW